MSSLTLTLGPMFAGKTTKLCNMAQQAVQNGENVLVINHTLDNRFTTDALCLTHDGQSYEAHKLSCLCPSLFHLSEYASSNRILIDEGQFFPDLVEGVLQCLRDGKHVVVASLNSDFRQSLFGQTHLLLPYASHVNILKAQCHLCEQPAIHSCLLTPPPSMSSSILVGGKNLYQPLCTTCMHKTTVPNK